MQRKLGIVTYNGIDGACAAAMFLLKYPDARLHISSAARIAETLDELRREKLREVHVCGVGVHCDWQEVEQASAGLMRSGTQLFWHCGRGYLDEFKDRFDKLCTPIFANAGTNTAAVASFLGVAERCDANVLMDLAWCDQHVEGCRPPESVAPGQSMWLDFIHAAMSQYFKYLEHDTYGETIRKLARQELGRQDQAIIDNFRRTGYRYVLHGRSPAIKKLKLRIQKCATVDRHLLITGESGVGKEHVAHLLWERSHRFDGPFIPVNCATYSGNTNLANSDLFGHMKGAFTGAIGDRKGKFIAAEGGILFLDELEELPPEVQAKLLRVVEDGWVTPEGADRPVRRVNVRIIAATNRDLAAMIRAGMFRADLYHRLAALQVDIPPLRERGQDIQLIAAERLALMQQEGHKTKLAQKDLKILQDYSWPGNVRQLIKVIERSVFLELPLAEVLEEEQALGDLAQQEKTMAESEIAFLPSKRDQVRPIKEVQRNYARRAWELYDRNYTAAARALGVEANTLRYTYLKDNDVGYAHNPI